MNRPAATNGEVGACILTPENMHTADDCTMHDHEPTIEGRTTWQVNVFANDGDEGPSDSWIIENRTEDEATRRRWGMSEQERGRANIAQAKERLGIGGTATFTARPGEKLPNGAMIVACRREEADPPRYIVLAMWLRGRNDCEYVTWASDQEGDCYWGHYHGENIGTAVQDYLT